jgi:hypothetical protein
LCKSFATHRVIIVGEAARRQQISHLGPQHHHRGFECSLPDRPHQRPPLGRLSLGDQEQRSAEVQRDNRGEASLQERLHVDVQEEERNAEDPRGRVRETTHLYQEDAARTDRREDGGRGRHQEDFQLDERGDF